MSGIMVVLDEPRAMQLADKAFSEGRLAGIVHVVDEDANPMALQDVQAVMSLATAYGVTPWIIGEPEGWEARVAEGAKERGIDEVWFIGAEAPIDHAGIRFTNPIEGLKSERRGPS
jgi:hypothetical protein